MDSKKTKTSLIQFRIDSELKQKAEEILNQLGLTFSSACTLLIKAVVNHGEIPFKISIPKSKDSSFPYNSENLVNNSENKVIVNLNE